MPRHYSRRMGRRSMKAVIQSYKKVIFFVNASFTSGFASQRIAIGVDSVAAGQTSATDSQVPTGCLMKQFEVQFAVNNSVATPCYVNCSLQYTLVGQAVVDPNIAGGNAQRNQILHQELFTVGQDQNSTHKFKVLIPKQFQRVREGMAWFLVFNNSATINCSTQMIYKFYR